VFHCREGFSPGTLVSLKIIFHNWHLSPKTKRKGKKTVSVLLEQHMVGFHASFIHMQPRHYAAQ
jgi:hypothetical protein